MTTTAAEVAAPLSSEYGTYTTVKARFWPFLSGKTPQTLLSGSNLARKRRKKWSVVKRGSLNEVVESTFGEEA